MIAKNLDFYLKWTACAVTLAGAACTALRWDPLNIYLLNLGAVLYLIWSLRIREWSLVSINAGLLIIYLIGLALTPLDPEITHQSGVDREIECRRVLGLPDE